MTAQELATYAGIAIGALGGKEALVRGGQWLLKWWRTRDDRKLKIDEKKVEIEEDKVELSREKLELAKILGHNDDATIDRLLNVVEAQNARADAQDKRIAELTKTSQEAADELGQAHALYVGAQTALAQCDRDRTRAASMLAERGFEVEALKAMVRDLMRAAAGGRDLDDFTGRFDLAVADAKRQAQAQPQSLPPPIPPPKPRRRRNEEESP